MITAVKSLAFDLIRAVDETSPQEALEQSITVAQQRIKAYRELNTPERIPDILRDALSVDAIERSAPERFVFSEEHDRNLKNGTDKKLKTRILGAPPLGHDESCNEIERCFRLRREAEIDEYRYEIAHPRRRYAHNMDYLSETAVATLRNIANHANERLHKQALKTLSDRGFIKPFRKKWRLTPDGERAIKYHAEKEAFYAKQEAVRKQTLGCR